MNSIETLPAAEPATYYPSPLGEFWTAFRRNKGALGGLIFMLAGRIPLRGEVIAHDSGVEFEVVEADPRRIKRVRMRAPGATASAPDAPRKRPAPQNAEQNAEDQIASETG